MKQIFKILSVLILGLRLISCTKDKENITIKYDNFIVELTSDLKILKVSNYKTDTLNYSKRFVYNSNFVEINQIDNKSNITLKSKYFLNALGLADSCIDSSYWNLKLSSINFYKFKYDNDGYKISTEIISKSISSDTISLTSNFELSYEIVNGNIKSININGYCSDYCEYSTLENKLDIFSFLGDYSGKKNSNLIMSYNSGCHYAPSTEPPSSDYDYKLNSNGLVIERVELYTSSYHVPDQKPNKGKRITKFEYKFE